MTILLRYCYPSHLTGLCNHFLAESFVFPSVQDACLQLSQSIPASILNTLESGPLVKSWTFISHIFGVWEVQGQGTSIFGVLSGRTFSFIDCIFLLGPYMEKVGKWGSDEGTSLGSFVYFYSLCERVGRNWKREREQGLGQVKDRSLQPFAVTGTQGLESPPAAFLVAHQEAEPGLDAGTLILVWVSQMAS